MSTGCLQTFGTLKLRAALAVLFLMLAAWQPGLAAAAAVTASPSPAIATTDDHNHSGDKAGTGHHERAAEAGADNHHPVALDTCCEMHCVMSQAMPAASPVIIGSASSAFAADFTHALPDGCYAAVIKPPRTTS
jgi:hypothetical protein